MSPTHSETLAAFIIRRRKEIAAEKQRILVELAALDAEYTQLEAAANAAGISTAIATKADPRDFTPSVEPPALMSRRKVASEQTIKSAVLEILNEAGHGMTAMQILPAVNARLGVDYPRTSLSPQLSRLKSEGVLVRDGVVWSLGQASQKDEAPAAHAAGASEPGAEEGGHPPDFKI